MSAAVPPAPALGALLARALPGALQPAPRGGEPYLAATPLIPFEHQPALVLAFAASRELDGAELLQRCLLPRRPAAQRLSCRQLLLLLAAVQDALASADTAFVLGQQLWPGHFGPASHALLHAADLEQALALLTGHAARLSPLLQPRLLRRDDELLVYWTDSCGGAGALRGFLVDLHMAALAALCRWRLGEPLPWRFSFNRTRPRQLEQHAVHLGEQLQFGCQLDAMRLPLAWLKRPWPRPQPAAAEAALQALARGADAESGRRGLLAALYDHLLAALARQDGMPGLEAAAAHFGSSPATLKRQLAQHGTHFQAELDQVRAHLALYLLHYEGCDNEALARHLGFHDRSNFRRSFKRWTGLTPGLLRLAGMGAG